MKQQWHIVEAMKIASAVVEQLSPHCERIEIAGSIRRKRLIVGDIEIVCIPRKILVGIFNDILEVDPGFVDTVNEWRKVRGNPHGKHTQRYLPGGMTLDLFMATRENWGHILAIRTGSAAFSHGVLALRWVKLGYKSQGGILYRDGSAFNFLEERDLFDLLGMKWIEPEKREVRE